MLQQPDAQALECGHYRGVQVLGVRLRRARTLASDIIAEPFYRALALRRICKRIIVNKIIVDMFTFFFDADSGYAFQEFQSC